VDYILSENHSLKQNLLMKRKLLLVALFNVWTFAMVSAQSFQLVKDLYPQKDSLLYDYDAGMTYFNGKLYFTSYYGDIVVSDGTAAGTEVISNLGMKHMTALDFHKNRFVPMGGKLYFKNKKNKLCVTDGTGSGTKLLADIIPTDTLSLFGVITILGATSDKLFFVGNDGETGNELWVSDGTEEGTKLVRNIALTTRSFFPFSSKHHIGTVIGDKLYFFATDGINGWEPWVSDGTSEGTYMLVNSNPSGDVSFSMASSFGGFAGSEMKFFEYDNAVYFVGFDGIYRTDGTVAGTAVVLKGNTFNSTAVTSMCVFDNHLYFEQLINPNRFLTKSDGTVAGTVIVDTLSGSMSRGFQEFNGELYFRCKPNKYSSSDKDYLAKLNGSVIDSLTRSTSGYFNYSVNMVQPIGNDFLYMANYYKHAIYRYDNGANTLANPGFTSTYDNLLSTPIGTFAVGVNADYGYELWKWEGEITKVYDTNRKKIVHVYPNPSDSYIHIEVQEAANMKVINTTGVSISTHVLTTGTNKIDVSSLANGVYFISFDKGEVVMFIKE
jgi:ELWxxDGT repeat protein